MPWDVDRVIERGRRYVVSGGLAVARKVRSGVKAGAAVGNCVNRCIEYGRRTVADGGLALDRHIKKGMLSGAVTASEWLGIPMHNSGSQAAGTEKKGKDSLSASTVDVSDWEMAKNGVDASKDTLQRQLRYCIMRVPDSAEAWLMTKSCNVPQSTLAPTDKCAHADGPAHLAGGMSGEPGRPVCTLNEDCPNNAGPDTQPFLELLGDCSIAATDNPTRKKSAHPVRSSSHALPRGLEHSEVTCCRFSLDGSRLIQGTADGHVMAWNVQSGSCLFWDVHLSDCPMAGGPTPPVIDCFIFNDHKQTALSVDGCGKCIMWTKTKNRVGRQTGKRSWEPKLLRIRESLGPVEVATFSNDGTRLLVVSRTEEAQDGSLKILIFVVCDTLVTCGGFHGLHRIQLRSRISCDRNYNVSHACFSPSGNGLTVGISCDMPFPKHGKGDCGDGRSENAGSASAGIVNKGSAKGVGVEHCDHCMVVVWPDYKLEPEVMYELPGVALSCWSADSSLLATWNTSASVSRGAFRHVHVWDVMELARATECMPGADGGKGCNTNENSPGLHQQKWYPPAELSCRPDWCKFLSADILVTCTVHNGVLNLTVWDALIGEKMHSVGSDIKFKGPILGCKGRERRSWLEMPFQGLRPIAMSQDRRWLACYCQKTNVGYVWDAEVNSELVKFRIANQQDMPLDGRFYLVFAKTANLLALVGRRQTCILALDHKIDLVPDEGDDGILQHKDQPQVLCCPDGKGLSALACCIHDLKITAETLETMLDQSRKEKNTKVQFCFPPFGGKYRNVRNALSLAVKERRPEVVWVLLKAVLEGQTNIYATSQIYQDSLVKLAKIYPNAFERLLKDRRFMYKCCHRAIRRPESWLLGRTSWTGMFHVVSDDHLIKRKERGKGTASEHAQDEDSIMEEIWDPKLKKFRDTSLQAMIKRSLARGNSMAWKPKVIPIKDIAQIGKRGILRGLLVSNVPPRLFALIPIQCVIAYKWETYAGELFLEEVYHYSALLILFTAYAVLLGNLGNFGSQTMDLTNSSDISSNYKTATLVFLFLSMALAFMNLIREVQQLVTFTIDNSIRGMLYWMTSHWNWIELTSYLLLVSIIPAMHLLSDNVVHSDLLSVLVAVEVILLWWKVLFFLQVFEPTAPMVIMVRTIVRDIRFFLVLAFSVMFGFSLAFFIIFRHNHQEQIDKSDMALGSVGLDERDEMSDGDELAEKADDMFGSLGKSLLTLYATMLGDFDLEVMEVPRYSGVALTLYILYMITLLVILLNLLIAIMGNSFTEIKETEKEQFLLARATAIDDIESMLSTERQREISKKIKRYLHVLTPRCGTMMEKPRSEAQRFARKTLKAIRAVKQSLEKLQAPDPQAIVQPGEASTIGCTGSNSSKTKNREFRQDMPVSHSDSDDLDSILDGGEMESYESSNYSDCG